MIYCFRFTIIGWIASVYKKIRFPQNLGKKKPANTDVYRLSSTPRVGLEPTTTRLTAARSTDWAIEEYSVFSPQFSRCALLSMLYRLSYRGIFIFFSPISSVCITINALPLSYRGLFIFIFKKVKELTLFAFFQHLAFLSTFKTTHCISISTNQQGQAFDLLVFVSFIHYCTSTSNLSTSSSSRGLIDLRQGYLILRGASRLDAFSVYPGPTWLPGHAPGGTTGTPEVSPPRSSRTKGSSSQISCARAG